MTADDDELEFVSAPVQLPSNVSPNSAHLFYEVLPIPNSFDPMPNITLQGRVSDTAAWRSVQVSSVEPGAVTTGLNIEELPHQKVILALPQMRLNLDADVGLTEAAEESGIYARIWLITD